MTVMVAASHATQSRPEKPSHRWRTAGWVALAAVLIVCFSSIEVKWGRLLDLPGNLWRYAGLMFAPPDFSAFGRAIEATMLSVQMAWFGTVLGIIVSLPLSFLAASSIGPVWLRWPLRVIFAVTRAVPEVVIAILILSVTGLTAFTGALAIAIGSVGTLGKWGYEAVEGAERGPIEAARAAGGSTAQVVRWGLWPTVAPEVFAFWLYRFEINVRASAILGLIGAGGIGSMLVDNVQYRQWGSVGMLLIVVVAITVLIDQISGTVRRRVISGRWGAKI